MDARPDPDGVGGHVGPGNGLDGTIGFYMRKSLLILALLMPLVTAVQASAKTDSTLIHLNDYSYFYGRQYYVLRSGRTQMFIQSDKVDLGSAFTYLLFDADDAHQSARKDSAVNFSPVSGFQTSALEVEMGGYPFVALGQNTTARWIYEDGIPKVEAVWWAGGIQVTEKIFAVAGMNTFVRSITLRGADIIGEENFKLRLGVPEGNVETFPNAILYSGAKGRIAIVVPQSDINTDIRRNYLEISDSLAPGAELTFNTFIVAQVPSGKIGDMIERMGRVNTGTRFLMETRARWSRTTTISTGDSIVENLFNNVRYTLPGYVSEKGIMDAGVFEYGGQWIRDASNTAVGLLQIGEFGLTRNLLSYMMDKMIAKNGATMISSNYPDPEDEEFDQMGELWNAMKDYYCWTGDSTLLVKNAGKLIAMTNRPLEPQFRDSTGMVHGNREYWERFLGDGYELAYQVWVIKGLRDAVQLAPVIGAEKYVSSWSKAEEKMLNAMLRNPKFALIHDGAFIKRRSVTGKIVDTLRYKGYVVDSPAFTESLQKLMPDASMALPITLGIVNPRSDLARNTLDELQSLWDARWSFGGYDRYNTSSEPDQPGPWSVATALIMRAQQAAGMYERSRETLDWLAHVQGGHTGAFFEEIPINRHQEFKDGILPWASAEVAQFVVRDWLGVGFMNNRMVIKPNLYPGTRRVEADLRYRESRVKLTIERAGPVEEAIVNGTVVRPQKDGAVILPADFRGGTVIIKTR